MTSPKDHTKPILVIGSTGKTGKRVLSKLQDKGVPVRQGSRSSHPAFDWEQPSSWEAALVGVETVYLTYYPDLAVPAAPAAISNFCKEARRLGTKHIVLLSGRGEPAAQHCEAIVMTSGMNWTVIRASWFNQNFSEGAFADLVESGTIALPVSDVGEPFIDVDDIADVAVAALTEAKHQGQLYEVTGPRLLSFRDVAKELSQGLNRDIQFVPVSMAQFTAEMLKQGTPQGALAMLEFLFQEVLDGRNAVISDGVQRALGRPAKDFSDYAFGLPR